MAKFDFSIPKEVMDDIKTIYNNVDEIFGGMTRAGAEVVLNNVKANVPVSEMAQHVKVSRVYKTPSDDGVNTKIYISGYFKFSKGRTTFTRRAGGRLYTATKGIPAPFIANLFEYGTSQRQTDAGANRGKMPKRPFFRKSFKKSQIEKAMLDAQKKLSGGLLDE